MNDHKKISSTLRRDWQNSYIYYNCNCWMDAIFHDYCLLLPWNYWLPACQVVQRLQAGLQIENSVVPSSHGEFSHNYGMHIDCDTTPRPEPKHDWSVIIADCCQEKWKLDQGHQKRWLSRCLCRRRWLLRKSVSWQTWLQEMVAQMSISKVIIWKWEC